MINHLRLGAQSRALFRKRLGRLRPKCNGERQQGRAGKPNQFVLKFGDVHTLAAAQPRRGTIKYLNPESVETEKTRGPRARKGEKRLVSGLP